MNLSDNCTLGTRRCRQWMSLITQQLRLRHVSRIFVFNLHAEKKSIFYFTLHKTFLDPAFYTSEKFTGKDPRWNELKFDSMDNSNLESIIIKIWKGCNENQMEATEILSWGIHFSGMVHLGNKIVDIQPRYFKMNTVIFSMQNGYFTSKDYVRFDIENENLPFYKNTNLTINMKKEPIIYRKIGIRVPKCDVKQSYNLEKLQKLQELQRHIKNKQLDVQHVKEKIKQFTESEENFDETVCSSQSTATTNNNISNNTTIRFAPQLLTMTSLNKMLHEKPTKLERRKMSKLAKDYELLRFRMDTLIEDKNRMNIILEKLKRKKNELLEVNVENESKLMAYYYNLHKDKQKLKDYQVTISSLLEFLESSNKQLCHRQQQLMKELLHLYPIQKIRNENKYTINGIYLPNSEILIDSTDPGISVVLGYICHILIMCSIFLQVPLRYPMIHFGSRSVIFDYIQPTLADKEIELPLYTKGKDKVQFGYAVFLLNKNLSDLRWYFQHITGQDMKETLKHLHSFLQGDDLIGDVRIGVPVFESVSFKQYTNNTDGQFLHNVSDSSSCTSHIKEIMDNHGISVDKLVTLPSTSNGNDPLLGNIVKEIIKKQQSQSHLEYISGGKTANKNRNSSKSKINVNSSCLNENCLKRSSEILALPEAYLNKQISEDFFNKCASREYNIFQQCGCSFWENQRKPINIKKGFEIVYGDGENGDQKLLDSIEQGTDLLDPLIDLKSLNTESINIKKNSEQMSTPTKERISRSAGSYDHCSMANPLTSRLDIRTDLLVRSSDYVPSQSLPDIPCQLTIRTDRLLSTNQSFNLVKHRPG